MPIYEYVCSSCAHSFELKQGFDADPMESCPRCQSPSRRKFHVPTVIYKGSGFYTTDYARRDMPSYHEDGHDSGASSGAEHEPSASSSD